MSDRVAGSNSDDGDTAAGTIADKPARDDATPVEQPSIVVSASTAAAAAELAEVARAARDAGPAVAATPSVRAATPAPADAAPAGVASPNVLTTEPHAAGGPASSAATRAAMPGDVAPDLGDVSRDDARTADIATSATDRATPAGHADDAVTTPHVATPTATTPDAPLDAATPVPSAPTPDAPVDEAFRAARADSIADAVAAAAAPANEPPPLSVTDPDVSARASVATAFRADDAVAAALPVDAPPKAKPHHDVTGGTALGRQRVVVANRSDGGFFYWAAKLYGFALLVIAAALGSGAVIVYSYFSLHAPPVPDLASYAKIAPATSRIYAADGTVLGEFAKQWREIVPYEKMPKKLVDAFLAVEDHEFFDHRGIYLKGIARALWRNITAGDFAQGGSTITQQVAKQFLGNEKSLSRKGKEAVIARRLESQYSKQAILAVYLNHIFLGSGAWGVAAAAHRYFNKELDQLTLAECALIAGLAKAPSKYSPLASTKLATERRNVVLDKMQTYGLASAEDVATAKVEPIKLESQKKTFPERDPYYAEHVRRYLLDKYGEDKLFTAGMRVETAVEPSWDARAYENVDFGARHQDKRQGWRGPEWRVDGAARDLVVQRQKQLYGDGPLVPGKRYLALVDKVDGEHAEVSIGGRKFQLPLRNMRWASKWQKGNADNDIQVDSATSVVKPGNVVWVTREVRTVGKFRDWNLPDNKNPAWIPAEDNREWDRTHDDVVRLEQVPHPQSTIFTADHHTGYVVAMVGGYDYDRSVFNRAVQACRQPGSTYKPIYYGLGLDQGYGFDTLLTDVPITVVDADGTKWTPENLEGTSDFNSTLEYALVFSKNVPSLDLFQKLGAKNVEQWARKLGFTTKIIPDDALALGASCSKLDEMARAFTLYARNGAWWPRTKPGTEKDWVYVRRILDREGNVVEDATVPEDPQLPVADRLDRTVAMAAVSPPQAISARVGFLMTKLLEHEVQYGFADVLRQTKINAAGKTGTSSATHDVMFIAYTSRFTSLVWMGDDKKERAIGRQDAAYMTVVPLWSRYMYEAARNYPNPAIPWAIPPGVKPDDRGDHSKGIHVAPMELYWRSPKRPPKDTPSDQPPA